MCFLCGSTCFPAHYRNGTSNGLYVRWLGCSDTLDRDHSWWSAVGTAFNSRICNDDYSVGVINGVAAHVACYQCGRK